MPDCERCGTSTDRLYEVGMELEDTEHEVIIKKVCWSCDHDVINGWYLFLDAVDILFDKAENDYEFDPINCERSY